MNMVVVEYYREDEIFLWKDIMTEKKDMSYVSYVRMGDTPSSLPGCSIAVCYPKDHSWQPVTFEKKDGGWIEKI